jgi:membrane associated rhomboid family serine protease
MAAAMRFVFQPGGPLRQRWGQGGDDNVPALPLTRALRDPRILAFLVVWLGVNLLFGLGGSSLIGENQSVAWEAHVGGFFAGLLLFDLFDRRRPIAPPLSPGDDRAAT